MRPAIELDDKYLFKISQQVKNNSNSSIDLFPYAQMTRNKIPNDIQNFYIQHEGFIGVLMMSLKEDDYDDSREKDCKSQRRLARITINTG